MKKKIIAVLATICLVFTAIPLATIESNAATASTTPATIGSVTVNERITQLTGALKGRYFTSDGTACSGINHATTYHNKCNVKTVLKSNSIVRNLLKEKKGKYNVSSYSNLPKHYYNGGSLSYGDSCCGFTTFAGWYLFSSKYTDKITTTVVAKCIGYNYSNMKKYIKPGDMLRLDGSHSAVAISVNSKGVKVIQSNFSTGGKNKNKVTVDTIYYSSYNYVGISRAKNYNTTTYTLKYSDGISSTTNDSVLIPSHKAKIGVNTKTTTKKFTQKGYTYSYWYIFKYKNGIANYWCRDKATGKIGKWIAYNDIPSTYYKAKISCGGEIYFTVPSGTVIYLTPVWVKSVYYLNYSDGLSSTTNDSSVIPRNTMQSGVSSLTTTKKFTRAGYQYDYWYMYKIINKKANYWCRDKATGKTAKWIPYDAIPSTYYKVKLAHGENLTLKVAQKENIYYTPVWEKSLLTLKYNDGLNLAENSSSAIPPCTVQRGVPATITTDKFIRDGYEYEYWYIYKLVNGKEMYLCKDTATGETEEWYLEDEIPSGYEKVQISVGDIYNFEGDEETTLYLTPVWVKSDKISE